MRCAFSTFAAFLITVSLAMSAKADDLQVGMQAMPRSGATLKLGTTPLALESIPQPYTVHKIQKPWVWVGTAWVKQTDLVSLDDAASYYTEQIRQRPSDALAYNRRGIVWEAKGELANAEKDFTEAIRLKPDNFAAYNNRGTVRDVRGDVDGALRDFTEAIRLKPNSPMALNNRGIVWRAKAEWTNAERDFSEAIRLDSKFDAALVNRAGLRRAQGDLAGALKDLDEALQVNGHSHIALNARAWLLATAADDSIGDGQRAVKDAMRACNLTAWQEAGYLDTLAAAFAANDDFGRAIFLADQGHRTGASFGS